jgi:hypothetical protein
VNVTVTTMPAQPIHDITSVRSAGGYRLELTFADCTHGEVDVASLISFRGIFEALRDPAEFASVSVDPEAGTVVWPNGADLDPLVLYSAVTNRSIESLITTLAVR